MVLFKSKTNLQIASVRCEAVYKSISWIDVVSDLNRFRRAAFFFVVDRIVHAK